jgi:drug/metabolite transporter (DMT)-like permease
MSENNIAASGNNLSAQELKHKLSRNFFIKGIIIGVLSGVTYGLYSAFVTVGMGRGVWVDWYGANTTGLSVFTITYILGVLGSGINDTMSAIWSLINLSIKGKIGDFFRCIRTKPGAVMMLCALFGGPIASAAYVVSLQLAGSVAAPVTALCPAVGAILGRILFKQKLNARMLFGIAICITASIMIGSTGFGDDAPEGRLVGCIVAFVAALGWGVEGCVAGYGTSLIDSEIGITIRQITAGILNLGVMIPLLSIMAGGITIGPKLVGEAFTSSPAMIFFIISGLFSIMSYGLWYKGNSMSGAALGMACNATYSFWTPFFCWIILGLFMGQDGWGMSPISWLAAIIMFVGILLIAASPKELISRFK